MAFWNRVRHVFGHRWAAFFGPVLVTLGFIGVVVTLIPDTLSSDDETATSTKSEGAGAEDTSAAKPGHNAAPAASAPGSGAPARRNLGRSGLLRSAHSPLRGAKPKLPAAAADSGESE
jgi:hypothetical protein